MRLVMWLNNATVTATVFTLFFLSNLEYPLFSEQDSLPKIHISKSIQSPVFVQLSIIYDT